MKLRNLLLLVLIPTLFSTQCRKNKTEEQLPPETQIGAGTLGFKIDGVIYKSNYPYPNAFATYIYMNFPYPSSSGYFFNVGGERLNKWYIDILTDSLQIFEGQTYLLNNNMSSKGKAFAAYSSIGKTYYTKPYLNGQFSITKLDAINKIISGIFWFDAIDTLSNTTVQIREGRFDLHYTE